MAEEKNDAREQVVRGDGWQNFTTGLGTEVDKRTHTHFGGALLFQDGKELDELYAGDDMIARVVDLPPQEMTREWIDIAAGEDGEAAKEMTQRLDDLDLQAKTEDALRWARLHGGALMILGIDDGQAPDKPLRDDQVRRLQWVNVVDRWEVVVAKRYDDRHGPKYGQPELYEIRQQSEGGGVVAPDERALVHESRVIRFDGVKTPRRRMATNMGWCDSIVTRVYEIVRDFSAGYAGAASTLHDFSVAVMKIQDLARMLATDQEDVILKRLALMAQARSIARAVFADAEKEDFAYATRTLAGMPDTLDRLAMRLSAGTGIPVTLLMGQSPAGLQATGASDIRLWYDLIKSQQESYLRPRLGRIIELLWRSADGPTGGQEPENWSIKFRPLWQPTEKEQAETRYLAANADAAYIDRGVVTPAEVAASRFGGDRWSMDTSIDIQARPVEGEPADDGTIEPAGVGVGQGATAPAGDVQKAALNGAQIASLVNVIAAVARREIPRESGIGTLSVGFQISTEEAETLLAEAGKSFVPAGAGEEGDQGPTAE